jgi:hypothetical protein
MAKFSLSSATIKLACIGFAYGTFGTKPNMHKAVKNGQTRAPSEFRRKTFDETCVVFKVAAPQRRRRRVSGASFARSDRRNVKSGGQATFKRRLPGFTREALLTSTAYLLLHANAVQ